MTSPTSPSSVCRGGPGCAISARTADGTDEQTAVAGTSRRRGRTCTTPRDGPRGGHRALAEPRERGLVQPVEARPGLGELLPRRERDLRDVGRQVRRQRRAVHERARVDVDDALDARGVPVEGLLHDRPAAAVPDEHDAAVEPVDEAGDRGDMVRARDVRAVRGGRAGLQTRQGHRVGTRPAASRWGRRRPRPRRPARNRGRGRRGGAARTFRGCSCSHPRRVSVTPVCHHSGVNRTERLYALAEELRRAGRTGTTGPRLAAALEVSERTIKRDVAALQQAGLTIWAQAGPGAGTCWTRARPSRR